MKAPICYGQTRCQNSVQEHYESASRHAGIRAKELRKAGFNVITSSLGLQVTNVGLVRMTMLTISGDGDLPEVTICRL